MYVWVYAPALVPTLTLAPCGPAVILVTPWTVYRVVTHNGWCGFRSRILTSVTTQSVHAMVRMLTCMMPQ